MSIYGMTARTLSLITVQEYRQLLKIKETYRKIKILLHIV